MKNAIIAAIAVIGLTGCAVHNHYSTPAPTTTTPSSENKIVFALDKEPSMLNCPRIMADIYATDIWLDYHIPLCLADKITSERCNEVLQAYSFLKVRSWDKKQAKCLKMIPPFGGLPIDMGIHHTKLQERLIPKAYKFADHLKKALDE